MQFHSYLMALEAPTFPARRAPRPGRRRHPVADDAATRTVRPRRRPARYPGVTSLLRP